MKKLFALFIIIFATVASQAQVQQGLVKTRGRLDSNGKLISGVGIEKAIVKVKNENSVISDTCGTFKINLKGNKYYLENVSKKGYQLVDMDILSRQYTCSPDTLKIVLTTPEQQLEDELANERKLRRTLNRQLLQREDEIEELYASQKILKAERDSALRELDTSHANNEKLIKDMVERYSRIDFDQLDNFNRRISEYILEGELLKADSMLNSKGDILSRIEEYRLHKQANEMERIELAEREKSLAQSENLAGKKLEDLACDCYSKFEFFKMQHLNDSAAFYIELRASLDTTNYIWQLDAGGFISEYIADYDKANRYSHKALQSSLDKHGERHPDVAISYNNIGFIHSSQGNYSQALEYHQKSLEIRLEIYGERHPDVATSYNNIGLVLDNQGNYSRALEYYLKSLEIRLETYGERHPNVATSYNNIGCIHYKQGNYSQALKYYNKSLEIRLEIYGERHPDVATSYNNIGGIHTSQGNYSKALEYYQKSLEIRLEICGERHPDVAMSYNNIGVIHYKQGNYSRALEYLGESYSILKDFLPSDHSYLLMIQQDIEIVKAKISGQ